MVELALPKNSKIVEGKTWPKPEGATRLAEYRIYRWSPDDDENPRMDTYFVDLDDCLMGPPIQDLWMLLSGTRREMSEQFTHLLEGYSHFATFDARELVLVESLRTLRMIHYSAWLARRWVDPAFPAAFPWFVEPRYWENQILALREQLAAIAEGPLEL